MFRIMVFVDYRMRSMGTQMLCRCVVGAERMSRGAVAKNKDDAKDEV